MNKKAWIFASVLFISLSLGLGFLALGKREAPPPLPPCDQLPKTGPVGKVSIFVGQDADKPDRVCLRHLNLSKEYVSYEPHSYILQTQGIRRDWSSTPIVRVPMTDEEVLFPTGYPFDISLPFSPSFSWFRPRQYRICVRFYFSGQSRDKQQVCSESFSLV